MDPFVTARQLWHELVRRRRLAGLVVAVAILIGALVAFRPGLPPESREYDVWVASTDILVDTSDSQVVDARGPDFTTLAARTGLLGNLIATEPLKSSIADKAGVAPDRLVVVPPVNTITTDGDTLAPTPVTTKESTEIPDSEATKLTVTTDSTLPILRVTAQAPSSSTAAALVGATVSELEGHLSSVAQREQIPATRKLVVRQLAAPTPAAETRGTPMLLGIAVAILLALLGCAAIAVAPSIRRRWRASGQAEPEPAEPEQAEPELEAVEPESEPEPEPQPLNRAARRAKARESVRESARAKRPTVVANAERSSAPSAAARDSG